jgi:glucose dehydrogenase
MRAFRHTVRPATTVRVKHALSARPSTRSGRAVEGPDTAYARHTTYVLVVAVAVAFAFGAVSAADDKPHTTWSSYLGSPDSNQYSALKQINKSNVKQLDLAWTFAAGTGTLRFDPVVVDGVMYVLGANRSIVALDAATGKEIWTHRNEGAVGDRGMNYWESKDRSERRLMYMNGGFLTSIDAKTGNVMASFGDNGKVDVRIGLRRDVTNIRPLQTGNPGRIFENLIIMSLPAGGAAYASNPGDTHAYDVRSGELKWVFHSVPAKGEFGADSWPEGFLGTGGGVHNWSELSVDDKRGIVYIPFGTARFDFYGGNRKGNNLFGNSLVALDAHTGKRLWHYQLVHHDLWDYDLPQAPKLLTLRKDGRNVDVVAQATKHGFVFVFDRVTGAPFFPIEERPVPQTDVPGEWTSPTQPFPTAPPPFARQTFTEKDVNPFLSQADQAKVREMFKTVRNEGLFTPPSLQGTISIPGHNGGANWGSTAVDPTKGTMYVVSKNLPTLDKLVAPGAAGQRGRGGRGDGAAPAAAGADARGGRGAVPGGPDGQGARGQGAAAPEGGRGGPPAPAAPPPNAGPDFVAYNSPYDFLLQTNGLSAIGPPWSNITAYDLNKGTILWQIPNGDFPGLAPGSHAPRGGPVVTAGGLIFVGTSTDRKLRAYDQDNGKVLWEREVPAAVEGVPAVYEVNGRQFVAISVGSAGLFPPRVGDPPPPGPSQYMVFALPRR